MLTLILIICIILITFSLFIGDNFENLSIVVFCISASIGFIDLIILGCVSIDYFSTMQVSEKIEMYQSENKQIEEKINKTVSEYMKFENQTYKELKGTDGMTLITVYPDLKSNELVKEQIKTYTKNNDKIKKLKNDQLDRKTYKYLLYFGG